MNSDILDGTYDSGFLELGYDSKGVVITNEVDYAVENIVTVDEQQKKARIISCTVERGMSWDEAQQKLAEAQPSALNGYYKTYSAKKGQHLVSLVVKAAGQKQGVRDRSQKFIVYKPNLGFSKREFFHSINDHNEQMKNEAMAERMWKRVYEDSEEKCLHQFWGGGDVCKNGDNCDHGRRNQRHNVLTGCLLTLGDIIVKFVTKPKIVRVTPKHKDAKRFLGFLLKDDLINGVLLKRGLLRKIEPDSAECSEEV